MLPFLVSKSDNVRKVAGLQRVSFVNIDEEWHSKHVLGQLNFDLTWLSWESSSNMYSCLYPVSKFVDMYQLMNCFETKMNVAGHGSNLFEDEGPRLGSDTVSIRMDDVMSAFITFDLNVSLQLLSFFITLTSMLG